MKLFNKRTDKLKVNPNQGLYKEEDYREKKISKNLKQNKETVFQMMGESPDLKLRSFYLSMEEKIEITIIYMNGLIDQNYINETVIDHIIDNYHRIKDKSDIKDIFDAFKQFILTDTELAEADTLGKLFSGLLGGDTILLIDGYDKFYVIGSRKYSERAVSPPSTHVSVIGPKDSFTENILTNINLVRRRIKNPNLWTRLMTIGKDTNTDVMIMYLKGVASDSLVTEVYNRLKSIELTNVLDSSYIEGAIREKKFSIFPTLFVSERPDVISANLLEGRVAIFVDGSPFVLVAPTLFIQFIQSAEDYYQKAYVSFFFRTMRMGAVYISTLLPAIYVALIGVNPELLPFQLLVKISGQREGIPFPAYIEAILMTLIFELLKEASIRVPTVLGSAITTAGALVLGQSAVEAGIISPIMVVVVSITAISTLVIPNYRLQIKISILKYFFIFLGAFFGIYGITVGIILLYTHLCSVRSFGLVYYEPPLAPINFNGLKDSILRVPISKIFKRPKNITERFPH